MHRSKGKLSGVLHKGFKPDKCKIALKLAMARIKLLRNRKEVQVRQMRREVAQLLDGNQDQTARIRVEHVIREEKFMQAYDLIELYCELIVARMSIIDAQKTCPIDLKEAIASVLFASMRCSDVTELEEVRKQFTSKYGKEFAAAALEVRPDSGVNRLVIEKLSAGAPDVQTKTKTLSSIAAEHNIKWDPKAFEEDLQKQNDNTLPARYSGGNIPTTGSSAPSMPAPQPAAPSYSSVETAPSFASSEVPANRNQYGTANAYSQENRRGSDASVPSSSQHGASTYSSAQNPGSNNFSHENTGGSGASRPYSQYDATVPGTTSRNEEINQPRDRRKSSVSGSNWNVEFKDATSAAQAAAESAEMASIAARAAAQLASRGNFSGEQNSGSYESAAYMHGTTPRKQQAEHSMRDDKRSSNEQNLGINDPRTISSNASRGTERADTSHVSTQNISSPYSAQFHSYGPEIRADVYDTPTEPPRTHSPEPSYFDDLSEKESSIGAARPEDHSFDLPGERFSDAGFGGHNAKEIGSRQSSFNQENTNNYYGNFSSSHGGRSPIWDNQNDKTGADSSDVIFDQYDYDVEEENRLDPFSSKHTEETPTGRDHKGFSNVDWSQQSRSESSVDHSTSALFSGPETQPSYDVGTNRKDIPTPHSYDSVPPTFDSDGASSDEEIDTDMHVESSRSHSRGSTFSENKKLDSISGKLVPDDNESIEDYESRSSKPYENPPGFNVFHKQQHSDGSPRSDYSRAQTNLGRVQSREYDFSDDEAEQREASRETTRANDNQPLPIGTQTSATSGDNDEGDLGLNFGRLTPGLRNKLKQPPSYGKDSGNSRPKQSSHKAPFSIEDPVYSKENETSFEETRDSPKSSRSTKKSFGANYSSEVYDKNQTVRERVESRSSVTSDEFFSGDTGRLSQRSGSTGRPITAQSSVGANSSQDLHHDRTGSGARKETRSRNARSYFDSDDSEGELEQQETVQTKFSREQMQSRRTREATSDTKRDGRVRTGSQYADETETTPMETTTHAEAFFNPRTERRREAAAYSRVSVQQPSPKPVRIQPPTSRGKSQEFEPNISSPENEGSTGRVRTGSQYADEIESTPKETTTHAEAFFNPTTGRRKEPPAYSRVSLQQPSPKPVRIQPPTARGKSQEFEPNRSSSPENEGSTETSIETPKESTPTTAPSHVHPKLPTDYDSFAAHFRSLRTNRR